VQPDRGQPLASGDDADLAPMPRADRDFERVRAVLDLEEGRGPVPVLDDAAMLRTLCGARRIAVIGASPRPERPSHGVMETLLRAGYDVVPVRPGVAEVLGRPCYPNLETAVAAVGLIDIIDVFRAPEACAQHAREAVAVGAGCLWLQLGIVSWEAAQIAHVGGMGVVMNRCTAVELARCGRTRR
jgi:predicted CoA-binding protein